LLFFLFASSLNLTLKENQNIADLLSADISNLDGDVFPEFQSISTQALNAKQFFFPFFKNNIFTFLLKL